jgi:hypothetical protein
VSGLASAVYVGAVRHRRRPAAGVAHAFRYPLAMLYLDLAELPRVFGGRWLWSLERPNLASFHRADYLGPPDVPLDEAVRARVAAELGARPAGPIRLLTLPRCLGWAFNPVSFYFCFDPEERLQALLAEITNTPWGERHAYVLPAQGRGAQVWRFPKRFHVSPFHDLDHELRWRLRAPGPRLTVHMENLRGGERVFDATLSLARRPLDGRTLARLLLRHPAQSLQVQAAIYWQALRLWWKGAPFFPHPSHRPLTQPEPA